MGLEKVIKTIEIEMSGSTKRYMVQAKQGDRATRFVKVVLLDHGAAYNIPVGSLVTAYFRKPDRHKVYTPCEFMENEVTIELNSQTLAAAGTALCEVEVKSPDMVQVVTSVTFEIEIEEKVKDEDAIISGDELSIFDSIMKQYADQEISRQQAESKRAQAETSRVQAETARQQAESERVQAESERVQAETARQQAEKSRQTQAAEALDAAYKQLIDGTNTTRVFWTWYPYAVAAGETDRYKLLSRFAQAVAEAWSGKTYTLRSYDPTVSGTTKMTPMDDLAGATAAQLCTENTTAIEDWADEDPMTWYIRANALSLEDGTMDIKAFEGEDGFDITGASSPVYTFAIALWIKEWNDGAYDYISFRTTRASGYYPDAGDVDPKNQKRPITWHATFPGGLDSKGALTSGAGIAAYNFASASGAITKARQKGPYEGLWNDCDTRWLLRMWQLRHFDLENSNIAEGCTSYSYQYMVAMAEKNVKRVLLTSNQAAGFLVGSTVSIGDPGTQESKDRGYSYMRNIADLVQISSIEEVIVNGMNYTAINLNIQQKITTTPTTYISTMPWHSGNTEQLPGHKDGCTFSLTAGKTPLRVAGVEVMDGAYTIGLDPLYKVTANEAGGFDYAVYECKNSQNLSGSITSDYEETGITYIGMPTGWNYIKAFTKTRQGVLLPQQIGGSSATYYKSAFCGASSAGVRCPWRFASLNYGGYAGLAAEVGSISPGNSSWYSRPRLCGAGKKRGEWSA